MKKFAAFVIMLVMAISLSAQFKSGMDFRTRAEMFSMTQNVPVWNRITDLRFRPWMSYSQNEYVCAKWVIEIGDIGFGNAAQGGAIGTDGINVETKNLFLQITPNKDNVVIVGLQPYKDFHALLLDWDIAGISWKNRYSLQGKDLNSFFGWFVSSDSDEELIDDTTYSFGNTEIVADFEYLINDKMKVGVNNIIEFSRQKTSLDNIHAKSLNLWSAPYFAGTFEKFYVEAVVAANNIKPQNEVVYGDGDEGYTPEHTGIIFSLKTKYDINTEANARFNFLFRDGDGSPEAGYNVFYGIHSYYKTGLAILTESSYGLDGKDQVYSPLTSFLPTIGNAGIILPSVFFDYDVTKQLKNMNFINKMVLSMGLGYGLTAIEIDRLGSDGIYRPESYIGTELDFVANVQMFDNLSVVPYFAILFAGDWYDYEGGHDPFTKIGITLNTKLK